ncbi:MAG TPA: hypothetical protein VKH42_01465 [Vicinamibacterales bacterium]|nr:hypothetical protein [Vicinamibacterales bacterium]
MRVMKTICCAAAIVAALASGARADEWNKRTFLTFSGPVQVPGATLPAGTYLFQLADPDNARHVVMVRDKDEKKIYTMFMTIPNDRLDTPDDNVVMFRETPAGVARAVKAWWYPGNRVGEEFVYPKTQATAIAKATHDSVLSSETNASTTGSDSDRAAMKSAKVGRVDDTGAVTDDTRQTRPATTTAPTAAPANTATGRDVKPQTTTATTTDKDTTKAQTTTAKDTTRTPSATATGTAGQSSSNKRHLPRTASELALIQLLSGLSLAGGLGARMLRK